MGHDPEDAIMLDDNDNDREICGKQQASLSDVEYIDLQDNKYYKSRAYASPSIRYKNLDISTSQARTSWKIDRIQKKPVIHVRGSTSFDQDQYQQLNMKYSHQDVPMNGMQNLTDVKARKNMTNSPGFRNSSQQLQATITRNGADIRLDALSRDCQRGPSIPRPRLTSLQPFRREQVPNGVAHEGPNSNADTAGSHPPQGERSAQARPSTAPKMGCAALETLVKARPAPFGTLNVNSNSHREKQDQLFVSDSEDQGQGGDRLGFKDPDVPSQKASATQQENVGKQSSPWSKQSTSQTQKSSRGSRRTTKPDWKQESRRLARELVPTEACGVFSESRVPTGCNPAQHIPTASEIKRTRNMTCIICGSRFDVKQALRNHFAKCVQKNGNPNRHYWFDHPTVRNNNGTNSGRPDDGFGPFSKKADDAPAVDASISLPELQTESPAAVEHKNTGGKGISDATIASWLAAQSENADIEAEDNYSAETEIETSDSAWNYHVVRQEIRTADLGLEEPIERNYGPYWTLEEANTKAGEEVQIWDLSPPPIPHPKGWNLQFRKDENGMDSHTVEVQGMTITTIVTRSKSFSSHTMPFLSPTAPSLPTKSADVKPLQHSFPAPNSLKLVCPPLHSQPPQQSIPSSPFPSTTPP